MAYKQTPETGTNVDRDRKSTSKEVPLEWSKTSAPLIGTNLHWPEITTGVRLSSPPQHSTHLAPKNGQLSVSAQWIISG